jgi:hypothetical protein
MSTTRVLRMSPEDARKHEDDLDLVASLEEPQDADDDDDDDDDEERA